MPEWTAGYVADIEYTYGYYQELNPLRARLAFLHAGLALPTHGDHCELGFGQGLSTNIHAAASGHAWHGCDFNPVQACFAQSLTRASGARASLTDEGFADFCTRTDLPDFDSIGLHGIWSWINDENRTVIVDFVRRKLKVGGTLYISYNTQVGWAPMLPMRSLLTDHADVMGVPGQGIGSRIDGALAFAERLIATDPRFIKANPDVAARLQKIKGQNRNYVAHEYFNRDWLPMPFSRMAQYLAPAKLDYACPAFYNDHIDALNLTAEQMAFLNDIPDRLFRETVRDFMVNQTFRKDYWAKGVRRLDPLERAEALREQAVVLQQVRADVQLKMKGALGEITMQGAIYDPILDLLSDHQPRTLGQIEQALSDQDLNFTQLTEAVMLLAGTGSLAAAQEADRAAQARQHTDRLNKVVLDKARSSDSIQVLASPVTGGGVIVYRFAQLFLLAISQGMTKPDEWAQFVWKTLQAQGRKIVKDGKTLDLAEDNLAELTTQAQAFASRQLPVLQALQVA